MTLISKAAHRARTWVLIVSCVGMAGCGLLKKSATDAGDAEAADATAAEVDAAPPEPPAPLATNADDVSRFSDETPLDKVLATVQRTTKVREIPGIGNVVATLATGASVTKIAQRSTSFLLLFENAADHKALMGWVGQEAFTAPATGATASVKAPKCEAPEVALIGDAPFCGRVCTSDAACASGQACKGAANTFAAGKAGAAVRLCISPPRRGLGDASVSLGFEASTELVSRVILAAKNMRGFIYPRSVADVRGMKPGEMFALRGLGKLGGNFGLDAAILVAEPTGGLAYRVVVSAGVSGVVGGQLDVQLVRMKGDEVVVDVGVESGKGVSFHAAIREGWGVKGICEDGIRCLRPVNLGVGEVDLSRLGERAVEKRLNSYLSFRIEGEAANASSRVSLSRFRFHLDAGVAAQTLDARDPESFKSEQRAGVFRLRARRQDPERLVVEAEIHGERSVRSVERVEVVDEHGLEREPNVRRLANELCEVGRKARGEGLDGSETVGLELLHLRGLEERDVALLVPRLRASVAVIGDRTLLEDEALQRIAGPVERLDALAADETDETDEHRVDVVDDDVVVHVLVPNGGLQGDFLTAVYADRSRVAGAAEKNAVRGAVDAKWGHDIARMADVFEARATSYRLIADAERLVPVALAGKRFASYPMGVRLTVDASTSKTYESAVIESTANDRSNAAARLFDDLLSEARHIAREPAARDGRPRRREELVLDEA
jgi:hypothetical protein